MLNFHIKIICKPVTTMARAQLPGRPNNLCQD